MRALTYPVFLCCRDYTDDEWWKRVFDDLCYNEPPKGVCLTEEKIYSHIKGKEFEYVYSVDSSEDIFFNIKRIYIDILGMTPKNTQKKTNLSSTKHSTDKWTLIKNKSLKENLIRDFIINSKRKYKLPKDQVQKLLFYLTVGMTYKLFNAEDITMQGIEIEKINGITFGEGCIIIDRHFEKPSKRNTNSHDLLYKLWLAHQKSSNEFESE